VDPTPWTSHMSKLPRSQKHSAKHQPKGLHPRNIHRQGYDFESLIKTHPQLAPYVKTNVHGNNAIEFSDPLAVKALNRSLLHHHYGVVDWDIPVGALCPPIPGRVDYIHYVAQLLGCTDPTKIMPNTASTINLLDIGTGASAIYPLLACKIYGWRCVASDINTQSLQNVAEIIEKNSQLKDSVTLRVQHDKNHIFEGIIQRGEYFDVSVCNPPFHASLDEALRSGQRKVNNLARNRQGQAAKPPASGRQLPVAPANQNFGGQGAELWCSGGERLFLKKLIKESQTFSTQCRWFTSLISKIENVKPAKKLLKKLGAVDIRELEMVQGNKITRILAWTYK
jgi:23S rRNA (adenine1618-N6)-methyltransferase